MATINVSLTDQMAGFVDDEVKSGAYVSASEVVREGLRLLQREKDAEASRLEILRREVGSGLADAQAGRLSRRSATEIAQGVLRDEPGAA